MARIQIEYPEAKPLHTQTMELRITDMNYGNHLAHDTLISLMHEARSKMFVAYGHKEIDIDGVGIVVADLAISYRAEVFYPDTLIIEVVADEFSRKGADLIYRVTRASDGGLVALAKTGIVFFDYQARSAVNMPEAFKKMVSLANSGNS